MNGRSCAVPGEDPGRVAAGVLHGPRLTRLPCRQLPKRPQAALADDPHGRLDDGVEDAIDRPALAPDRAERVVEVTLLRVAVAAHRQQLVAAAGSLAGRHHPREQRADDVPDLRPHLAGRPSQRPGVLLTRDGTPVVVVEQDEVAPPVDGNGEAGVEADAQGRAQALRPPLGGAERGERPVECACEPPSRRRRRGRRGCRVPGGIARSPSCRPSETGPPRHVASLAPAALNADERRVESAVVEPGDLADGVGPLDASLANPLGRCSPGIVEAPRRQRNRRRGTMRRQPAIEPRQAEGGGKGRSCWTPLRGQRKVAGELPPTPSFREPGRES